MNKNKNITTTAKLNAKDCAISVHCDFNNLQSVEIFQMCCSRSVEIFNVKAKSSKRNGNT